MTKLRFTVRRYLVIDDEGNAAAHDFTLIINFEAIPNSHFRKAMSNKGKRRRMACGALTIVVQEVLDYRAGVTADDQ